MLQATRLASIILATSMLVSACGYRLAGGEVSTAAIPKQKTTPMLQVCVQTAAPAVSAEQLYAKSIGVPLAQLSAKLAIYGVNNQIADARSCPNLQANAMQLVVTELLQSETQFSGAIREVSQSQILHYYWYNPASDATNQPAVRGVEATVQFQSVYTQDDSNSTQYRIAAQTLQQKLLDKAALRIRTEWTQLTNACDAQVLSCVSP